MPNPSWLTLLAFLLACRLSTAAPSGKLGKDGFPTGSDTPEGAACDLARAFIHDDAALFLATCIEPYGNPEAKAAYHKFLEGVVVQMKMEPAGSPASPDAPRTVVKCFAARRLAKSPDGSAFGFQDVLFVDVAARAQNGAAQLCRTLVIKDKDGNWKVDPQPERSPLPISGLDDEPPSTLEYAPGSAGKRPEVRSGFRADGIQ